MVIEVADVMSKSMVINAQLIIVQGTHVAGRLRYKHWLRVLDRSRLTHEHGRIYVVVVVACLVEVNVGSFESRAALVLVSRAYPIANIRRNQCVKVLQMIELLSVGGLVNNKR